MNKFVLSFLCCVLLCEKIFSKLVEGAGGLGVCGWVVYRCHLVKWCSDNKWDYEGVVGCGHWSYTTFTHQLVLSMTSNNWQVTL